VTSGQTWARVGLALLIAAVLAGCAAGYARTMGKTLGRVQRRDWDAALEKLEKPSGSTNMLLYRLEKGLILHYAGDFTASNNQFQRAEDLIDRHYTRSASREVAALLTNDAIRAYSGEEYERVLIHYYRALNYHYLGEHQDALVECRKANLRLEKFAEAAEYKLSYRNDAFLQYLSGLFYEAEGEVNDAYISYRDAAKGYAAYEDVFGMRPPETVATDLRRTTGALGFVQEWVDAQSRWGLDPGRSGVPPVAPGTVTIFAESGFVGRKGQTDISLPITDEGHGRDVWVVSDRAVRHYHHGYRGRVKYWLRVALPVYQEARSTVSGVRVRVGDTETRGFLVQDLNAIAEQTLRDKENTILLRTAARGVAKWLATEAAEKESKFLGALVNLFGAGTEAADTRSWLSLPKSIWMARVAVAPGTTSLVLEFINAGGGVVDTHEFTDVQVSADRPLFLSWRSFR
jgi:hypothetical protein